MGDHLLGRRIPPDFEHVARYPLQALIEDPAEVFAIPPEGVEKNLGLPWWWKQHDQGVEGSCVGFGCSAMTSITNHRQRLLQTRKDVTYRYASRWLYLEAQLVDEWGDTPPGEGTSVRAGCEILQTRGHRRVQGGVEGPESPTHGISAYRWATTHDEIRAAIYGDCAVAIGVNWYTAADNPELYNKERWILRGNAWGPIRGGHCICLYRMSDRRQAFAAMNSWNGSYPPVWIPYVAMNRLLGEQGEACVVTDR